MRVYRSPYFLGNLPTRIKTLRVLAFMEQAQVIRNIPCRRDAARSVKTSRTRALSTVIVAIAGTCSAWPCSGVGPPGQPVVFGDQTNIVIWDADHRTEHFIRNANFRSGADNFGFIAPTPGKPELHEASNQAFYTLASLNPIRYFARGGFGGGLGPGSARSDEVQVIQEADVAGYHATTLWSRNAHAINDWMNQHGYVSTPEVEKWAERYTAKRWYLTAFKVIDKTKLAASTGTVRMSFNTDRPFNPFYVPRTNIPIGRNGTLRVYFVSVGDYDANIGNTGTWQVPQWTAPIPESTEDVLAKQVELPERAIPDKAQVEAFVDYNFPRAAADDIYFTKKREVGVVEAQILAQPRLIPPAAVLPFVGGFGLLALMRRRRNAA